MGAAVDALVRDVREILHAFDAGHLGACHRFSDGTESAFVHAVRESLARYSAQRQAEMFEEDYRRPPADLWPDINRVRHGRQ